MTVNEVNESTIGQFHLNLGGRDLCKEFNNGNRHRAAEQGEPDPEPERGKWAGHPGNEWRVISREWDPEHNYFKILQAMPVSGGGVMIESIWGENGRPAISSSYEPDLQIEERGYTGSDGIRRLGYRLVKATMPKPVRSESSRNTQQMSSISAKIKAVAKALNMSEKAVLERAVELMASWHELSDEKETT